MEERMGVEEREEVAVRVEVVRGGRRRRRRRKRRRKEEEGIL